MYSEYMQKPYELVIKTILYFVGIVPFSYYILFKGLDHCFRSYPPRGTNSAVCVMDEMIDMPIILITILIFITMSYKLLKRNAAIRTIVKAYGIFYVVLSTVTVVAAIFGCMGCDA